VLYHFCSQTSCFDGKLPYDRLLLSKGVLYGTTSGGGAHDCGTAHSFDPSSFNCLTLYSFCAKTTDPSTIYGGLTLLEENNGPRLYGVGLAGGGHGHGAVYMLSPPTTEGGAFAEHTLYSFSPKKKCTDGSEPIFGAPLDLKGVLYGATSGGGNGSGGGVVYRLEDQ
jgi:uncharacterized repeat protein (TIGR03803 family)